MTNQDTQAEGMERIVRLVRDKIFPFGIWHDHPAGYERRVEMIVKVLMQEIAAAEERGREQGRGEMIQNSEGFIQTALLPASAIAAAEERMVERVLGLIDAECEKIASRPCPHREETTRHEDSCALDGAQHMALTKIRKEVSELLNQLTPSKGEE